MGCVRSITLDHDTRIRAHTEHAISRQSTLPDGVTLANGEHRRFLFQTSARFGSVPFALHTMRLFLVLLVPAIAQAGFPSYANRATTRAAPITFSVVENLLDHAAPGVHQFTGRSEVCVVWVRSGAVQSVCARACVSVAVSVAAEEHI